MNDMNTPDDPFDQPAIIEQDHRHNAASLEHLRREICAETLEEDAKQAKPDDPDRWSTSCRWSELDRLALVRCAVWIAHADGYGLGVTKPEAADLCSRKPQRIATAARSIVRRLSETVTAPDADAQAVTGSEALAGILPVSE